MDSRRVTRKAREIARRAGYDPERLVVEIDPETDFDFLAIRCAPVDIKKIMPVFMKFYDQAEREIAKEGQNSSLAPA